MPLNIKVDNPAAYTGAVLEHVPTLAELIGAIPGLVGAFDAATLTQGAAVASWAAQYGTGVASQASSVRQPTAGMDGAIPVLRNGGLSRNLVVDRTFTSGAVLTAGARFKIEDVAQDVQAVFGIGTWRLLWRTNPRIQFDAVNDILVEGIGAGWHTALIMQSADTTRMMLDGQLYTAANAGAALTQMIIGASSTTGTANGFLGAISKFIIAQADLYGTAHQATALNFLNG